MVNKPNRHLTSTQEHALDLYRKFEKKHGDPPSTRQLAELLECEVSNAHRLIGILRDKGHLSMRPVTITRLKVTRKGWNQ